MRIDPFSLALSTPLETAAGTIGAREGFLVAYRHRGERGLGEATPLPGWTESREECRAALDRAADAADEEASARDGTGHGAALLELDAAEVPAARHGFGTALLSADARADSLPLYQWFQEDPHPVERVPVNATVGDAPVGETVAAAERVVGRGFECLKVKVGARPVEADAERLRAVREAVGGDVAIRADANAAYDRDTASRAMEAFAGADLAYLEQPLSAEDLAGHRDLRCGPVEIALDESLAAHPAQDVVDSGAADVLVLKPMVVGGPRNAHALALRARERGLEPVITTTIDGVVARTAAVHVAAAVPDVAPCGLATAGMLESDLGPDPCPVEEGFAAVPQAVGLGVEVSRGD